MEQLTGHLTDMSKKIVALSTAHETEPQTQRTAPRRTPDGLEARPQEQAAYNDQRERNERRQVEGRPCLPKYWLKDYIFPNVKLALLFLSWFTLSPFSPHNLQKRDIAVLSLWNFT